MDQFADYLKSKLSEESELVRRNDASFSKKLQRWSELGVEVPSLIALPAKQEDVATVVKEAVDAKIPFVPHCGGHSSWSTVKDGIVIDLAKYKNVEVHSDETATVSGGVLMKELQVALSEAKRFTAVANGNTVGVIPYYINGGISSYTPLVGYACENIVSARIITADGAIVEASEDHNSDLLWAIRGAGQFFGLVISITVRTYPLSLLSPDGTRQLGTYIFPVEKAEAVCQAMTGIINDEAHAHAGHFMIVRAPPHFQQQVLLVAPQFFGSAKEMAKVFQPLVDLGPLHQVQNTSHFKDHSDHLDYICAKGDFKKFSQVGIKSWVPENFAKVVDLHEQLVQACPGSEGSGYSFEWHTPTPDQGVRKVDTSFGLKDVNHWLNVLSWYTDPSQHEQVASFDAATQKQMREGTAEAAYITYTNSDREDPIEYRYKDPNTIIRLKKLKATWDSSGAFTRQLLD